MTGNLEVKKQICEHGGGPVTFTSKWNTDNIVNSTLEIQVKLPLQEGDGLPVQDHLLKGLRMSVDSSYAPDTGAKNGHFKAEMKTAPATLTLDTVRTEKHPSPFTIFIINSTNTSLADQHHIKRHKTLKCAKPVGLLVTDISIIMATTTHYAHYRIHHLHHPYSRTIGFEFGRANCKHLGSGRSQWLACGGTGMLHSSTYTSTSN